eukprot:3537764-Prymnesium_polylepis.1
MANHQSAALCAAQQPCVRIDLQCRVTHAPLVDPAKGASCIHQAICNYKNLCHRKKCPIASCGAVWHRHRVTRDEKLKAIVESAPPGAKTLWILESGEHTFVEPNASK